MSKWLPLLLVALLPAPAAAQPRPVPEYSSGDFEKFIRDDLGTSFTKKPFAGGIVYDIRGTPYYATLGRDNQLLLLYAVYPTAEFQRKVALEDIDGWNRQAFYSRAYLDNNGAALRYEGTLPLAAGATPAQVKSFFELFDKEHDKFVKHFGGLKPQPGAEDAAAPGGGPTDVVRVGFPAVDFPAEGATRADVLRRETGWEIEWDLAPVPGRRVQLFRIVRAEFFWKDKDGRPRSLVVARNLQLAEAFTQYDDRKTCFLDIARVDATQNLPASEDFLGPTCVGPGCVLKSKAPGLDGKVHKEVHYDGLRWMSVYGGVRGRKGEKLILWSPIEAGNYIYIIEYDFTDDGRIVCRLGFTAHNFYDRAELPGKDRRFMRTPEGDIHPHIGCWRMEFDLSDPAAKKGGPGQNEAKLVRRVVENGRFKSDVVPFPGDERARREQAAHEGSARWVAKEFTTLRVESRAVTNSRGAPVAYDLVSTRTGTAEDLMPFHNAEGADMKFINDDFWVTRTPEAFTPYHEVPAAARARPLQGQPATVWHSVPALHVPRDEDFGPGGVDASRGVALTAWVEFTLRPRNLFDGTPLYRPAK